MKGNFVDWSHHLCIIYMFMSPMKVLKGRRPLTYLPKKTDATTFYNLEVIIVRKINVFTIVSVIVLFHLYKFLQNIFHCYFTFLHPENADKA